MITLYTIDCPKCKVLKQKIDNKNINYNIVNDLDIMTNLGMKTAPMLEVNGLLLNFNEALKWVNEQ